MKEDRVPWSMLEKCWRKEIGLFDGEEGCCTAQLLWEWTLGLAWWLLLLVQRPKAEQTVLHSVMASADDYSASRRSELSKKSLTDRLRLWLKSQYFPFKFQKCRLANFGEVKISFQTFQILQLQYFHSLFCSDVFLICSAASECTYVQVR